MGIYKGSHISFSLFGESHGEAIGMVISGFPSGFAIDRAQLQAAMARRRPGGQPGVTPRNEQDQVQLVSGVLNDQTTGAPICGLIQNTDQRSSDYGELVRIFRPAHADYPAWVKYGSAWDGRGGGQFSGRLTAPMVFAGALCQQYLSKQGIEIKSRFKAIGPLTDCQRDDPEVVSLLKQLVQAKDSVGAVAEIQVSGLPPGLGGPDFDSLEGQLAQALFAIPGLKGLAFGSGFELGRMYGSQANDAFIQVENQVSTATHHNGGILGGISIGTPLTFDVVFKPTPSIGIAQQTLNEAGEAVELEIDGRHDPCIGIRGIWAAEAAAAMVLMDLWLTNCQGKEHDGCWKTAEKT